MIPLPLIIAGVAAVGAAAHWCARSHAHARAVEEQERLRKKRKKEKKARKKSKRKLMALDHHYQEDLHNQTKEIRALVEDAGSEYFFQEQELCRRGAEAITEQIRAFSRRRSDCYRQANCAPELLRQEARREIAEINACLAELRRQRDQINDQ